MTFQQLMVRDEHWQQLTHRIVRASLAMTTIIAILARLVGALTNMTPSGGVRARLSFETALTRLLGLSGAMGGRPAGGLNQAASRPPA
ncbi:hypothetical protein ACM43_03325 [Bradyrhizobium sp. CCBAU 45321]|nr:hypothetical protein [Bradyrhizobium sp. CCBAU 45321]